MRWLTFRECAISTLATEQLFGAFPESLAQILGIHQEPFSISKPLSSIVRRKIA